MDILALKRLVAGGENLQVEFKRKVRYPEKIAKEAVAFANTSGGWLLIGVEDDKTIYGSSIADEEAYLLEKAFAQYIFPTIKFDLERIRIFEEKEVLAYYIHQGIQKPYSLITGPLPEQRHTYFRVADKSVQASREIRELLKLQRKARSLRVELGAKEKLLFNYLGLHQTITLNKFALLAGLNEKIASRTLVLLVHSGLLNIHPKEDEDLYSIKGEILPQNTPLAATLNLS